jgi:hypothetical protein
MFLIAEGRAEGRLSGRFRAANFPRLRTDGTLTPDFRGVLETGDGAAILFSLLGYARIGPEGMRELVGSVTHVADDDRYRWLNDRLCAIEGELRERDGGFEVVVEVSELVWEPIAS